MSERERFIRDRSAVDALLLWGKRHADPFAQALALARQVQTHERWREITSLADHIHLPEEIRGLDAELEGWSVSMRTAPRRWALPRPQPQLVLARTLNTLMWEPGDGTRADTFVGSEHARAITSLYIEGAFLGDMGARMVAESGSMQALTTLSLKRCGIGDAGARSIAASRAMWTLTALHLDDNRIGVEGARALAASEHLLGLTSLYLGSNRIGDEGARAIVESEHLRSLTHLGLQANRIGGYGARVIAESTMMRDIDMIWLDSNPLGIEGIHALLSNNSQLPAPLRRHLHKKWAMNRR